MIRRLAIAVMAPVAAFALVACGGGGSSEPPERPAQVPADVPFIDQDNLKFQPTSLTVDVGEEVWFVNSETALHTVTVNGTNESGSMKKGETFTFAFPAAGEYKITCDFHPQMKATITVTEAK